MSIDDANSWLLGSSLPSCKFLEIGTVHEGQVMAVEMGIQRDYKTQKPKTWDDGQPMKQMIITLQTAERDPAAASDNGMRKLYIASKGMREALAAAVKKTGERGLAVGGRLGMKYVRDGEATSPGINPPKVYAVKYEPPTHAVDDGYDDGYDDGAQGAPTGEPNLDDYSEEPF